MTAETALEILAKNGYPTSLLKEMRRFAKTPEQKASLERVLFKLAEQFQNGTFKPLDTSF